jgi:hypothetical protein
MKDAPETNKFMGLKYYAVGSNNTIVSEGFSPDEVYYDAVSQGEQAPIIFGSNTIIHTKMTHKPQELKTYKNQKLMNKFNNMMIRIKVHLFSESSVDQMAHSKPSVSELDSITNEIITILQKDNEPMTKY